MTALNIREPGIEPALAVTKAGMLHRVGLDRLTDRRLVDERCNLDDVAGDLTVLTTGQPIVFESASPIEECRHCFAHRRAGIAVVGVSRQALGELAPYFATRVAGWDRAIFVVSDDGVAVAERVAELLFPQGASVVPLEP